MHQHANLNISTEGVILLLHHNTDLPIRYERVEARLHLHLCGPASGSSRGSHVANTGGYQLSASATELFIYNTSWTKMQVKWNM